MSFLSFFTDLQVPLIVAAVAFVAGVVLSTRVKDWFKGVPSELRTALNGAETSARAAIEQAQIDVLAKILPGAAQPKAPAPLAPTVTLTPLAPVAAAGPAPLLPPLPAAAPPVAPAPVAAAPAAPAA